MGYSVKQRGFPTQVAIQKGLHPNVWCLAQSNTVGLAVNAMTYDMLSYSGSIHVEVKDRAFLPPPSY